MAAPGQIIIDGLPHYQTIGKSARAEFKDRGSKFLAYSFPISSLHDFKMYLKELKREHPKAVHHCFAYRLGISGDVFRSTDDGEPSGTAGRPIMGQIDSRNLTDILVVVVRYFGGVLLGIPGLIHAYKTSASLVLQCSPVISRAIEINHIIEFGYPEMNAVMLLLKKYNCTLIKSDMQLFCKFKVGIPVGRLHEVTDGLRGIQNVEFYPED